MTAETHGHRSALLPNEQTRWLLAACCAALKVTKDVCQIRSGDHSETPYA